MSQHCNANCVSDRNMEKSGEMGAFGEEPEGGYLSWQKLGRIMDLIAISKLKDLCKSGKTENSCNGMEARWQSMAEIGTSGLRLLRVRMVKQFSGTNYTKIAINYKLRRIKGEG